jgi:hypothetical protein
VEYMASSTHPEEVAEGAWPPAGESLPGENTPRPERRIPAARQGDLRSGRLRGWRLICGVAIIGFPALGCCAVWEADATLRVHQIERNRWGGGGEHQSCYIFRDRDGSIVDWRWCRELRVSRRLGGGWEAVWLDQRYPSSRMLHVIAETYCETWTDRDRELFERIWLPDHLRRKLR